MIRSNFGLIKILAPVEIEKKRRSPEFFGGFQMICELNQEMFGKDSRIDFIRISSDNELILLNIMNNRKDGEIMYLLKVSSTSLTEVYTEFQVIQFKYIDAQFLKNNFQFIICWRTHTTCIGLFQYSNNSWNMIQQIDSFFYHQYSSILVSPEDKYIYVFNYYFTVWKKNSVTLDFEKQSETKIKFYPIRCSLSKSGQQIVITTEENQLIFFYQINQKWTIYITLSVKYPFDKIQFYGDNLIMYSETLVWWNKWQRKVIRKQKVKLSPFYNKNNTLSYNFTSNCCQIWSLRGFEFQQQSAIQLDSSMYRFYCSGDGSKLIIQGSMKVKIYEQLQQ